MFDVDHDEERAKAVGMEVNGFSFEGMDEGAIDYALNRSACSPASAGDRGQLPAAAAGWAATPVGTRRRTCCCCWGRSAPACLPACPRRGSLTCVDRVHSSLGPHHPPPMRAPADPRPPHVPACLPPSWLPCRALSRFFNDRDWWNGLAKRVMQMDWSWNSPA